MQLKKKAALAIKIFETNSKWFFFSAKKKNEEKCNEIPSKEEKKNFVHPFGSCSFNYVIRPHISLRSNNDEKQKKKINK